MLSLFRALAVGVLAWIVARALSRVFRPPQGGAAPRAEGAGRGRARPADPERLVRDPVCQVRIPEGRALVARTDAGLVHFCSDECRSRYLEGSRRDT